MTRDEEAAFLVALGLSDSNLIPDTPHPGDLTWKYRYLRAVAASGNRSDAASALGISENTLRHGLAALFEELGVTSVLDALRKVGWLAVPLDQTCGWVGSCSRPLGHRGHHGGFRGFAQARPRRIIQPR